MEKLLAEIDPAILKLCLDTGVDSNSNAHSGAKQISRLVITNDKLDRKTLHNLKALDYLKALDHQKTLHHLKALDQLKTLSYLRLEYHPKELRSLKSRTLQKVPI